MTTVGIVTGGARGMGLACAQRLVRTVDQLLLVDRDESVATTAKELSATSGETAVESIVVDVTDRG
nr:SDR family NAD(P)-dependent oxidoreductase [Micromonospora sp. DSM 115978]